MMSDWSELPPELLDDVHGRLRLLSRLAFAAVCVSWRRVHRSASGPRKPEAPWLVLPGGGRRTAALFSLSDGRSVSVHVPRPAMRSRVVVGSSAGWLVTADYWESRLHLLDPFTGTQAELPALTTMPCLDAAPAGNKFLFDQADYTMIRFQDSSIRMRRPNIETYCHSRLRHAFLRKVVLSPSTRPGGSYEAMLLRCLGDGPAFTAASDGREWRLAPSPYGAEDAIYYRGQFYSVAPGGVVESWERLDLGYGDGMYRSTVVTSKLAQEDDWEMTKYLVESPTTGQLMLLFRDYDHDGKTNFFKVEILDEERGLWTEVQDVGEVVFFIGINESLCLSIREYPELRASCVYFTDDDVYIWLGKQEPRDVGVYSLKDGTVEPIEALGQHRSWPPSAWIMPHCVTDVYSPIH